ncbi:hypothetical protein D3C71_1658480 [compost metagenome]
MNRRFTRCGCHRPGIRRSSRLLRSGSRRPHASAKQSGNILIGIADDGYRLEDVHCTFLYNDFPQHSAKLCFNFIGDFVRLHIKQNFSLGYGIPLGFSPIGDRPFGHSEP